MLERGMGAPPPGDLPSPERKLGRPRLSDIEPHVDVFTLSVAHHEYTHIGAIWGVGESTGGATVEPTSEYQGATFHAGHMSIPKMQIAAMASAEHEGKGSDQMKAYMLQYYPGGISMESAEGIAKSILASYRADILHGAAVFLAYYGSATDSQLRQFLRWAEEDLKETDEYRDLPIPSWSDELDAKAEEPKGANEPEETRIRPGYGGQAEGEGIVLITYQEDGTHHYHLMNGNEEVFCTHCGLTNDHTAECPNFSMEEVMTPEAETFWEKELSTIFDVSAELRGTGR